MTGVVRPNRRPVALVVDDQADQRVLIRRRIEADCDVIEAGSSEEALEIMKQRRVDIVFTDSNLPSFDGKEFCRQARIDLGFRDPFIFVTASGDQPSVRMEMIDAGADGILVKPYKGDELRAIVREVTGIQSDPNPGIARSVWKRKETVRQRVSRVMHGVQNRSKPSSKDPSER